MTSTHIHTLSARYIVPPRRSAGGTAPRSPAPPRARRGPRARARARRCARRRDRLCALRDQPRDPRAGRIRRRPGARVEPAPIPDDRHRGRPRRRRCRHIQLVTPRTHRIRHGHRRRESHPRLGLPPARPRRPRPHQPHPSRRPAHMLARARARRDRPDPRHARPRRPTPRPRRRMDRRSLASPRPRCRPAATASPPMHSCPQGQVRWNSAPRTGRSRRPPRDPQIATTARP
jgi:hypothetical protein